MHCKDGRFLELTVLVYVAPGALSSYTKIVRLLPRYIVVNALPYPIRLWQDSSVFRPVLAEQEQSYRGDFKWRYRKDSGKRTKVNQYDALWGREATIDAGFTGNISSSTTAHQAALYISTVGSAELVPFSLPDSRGQRQLRIGLGSPWNLTASFSADVAGDHVLALTRAIDLKMLPHVSTRASPEYVVALYPGIPGFVGELGVWYETEWGSSRRIIVKAVKKTSYAFNQTDIHVGDELLHIDGTSVAKKTFVEVMDLLRERLGEICASHQDTRRHVRRATMRLVGRPQSSSQGSKTATANTRPLMLRFRTVEERLRRVRLKAAKAGAMAHSHTTPQPTTSGSSTGAVDLSTHSTTDAPADFIKAELKTLHHMMFLVLREDKSPPFQIQNQTFSSTIYYRQKGCNGHAWHSLNPGETRLYAWQEPLKLKRLSVRVASETTFRFTEESNRDYEQIEGSESHDNSQHRSDRQPASKADGRKVTDEEDSVFSTTINVRLEEIGFRDFLPWQYAGKETSTSYRWLELEVDVVGATRVLLIRDVSKDGRHQVQWERHLDSLRQGIEDERIRLGALDRLNDAVIAHSPEEYEPVPQASCLHDVAESAKNLMADFSGATSICAPHQLIVEVIEAIGLSTDTFVGDCNPYAEVRLKSGDMRRSLFRKSDVRRTYFVKKSVKPTWELQTFVFDVPPEAVDVPRGHAVSIRLLNHRALRYDQLLGKAQVDLHTLRNQEPLVGWFPLAGRTGRRELENQLSHWGRGSVRLRLQWIYSIPALLQYFILLSENRVAELQTRLEGLVEQMQQRQAAEAKKMRESDGFKAVRIQDFISISQKKRRLLNGPKEGKPILKSENAKSTRKPLRADAETGFRNSSQTKNPTTRIEREPRTTPDSGKLRKSGRKYSGEKEKISHAIFHKLEERISQQRQNFHSLLPRRDERKNLSPNGYDLSALSVGTSLKSWTMAQVLFNDSALETQVGSQAFHTRLSLSPRKRLHQRRERPQSEIAVCEKLQAPLVAPVILDDFCEKQISYFLKSRETFECAARRSLAAVLHHGGWLTIRPIRALNLPDSYMGMTVKLRYGSQVLVTGTADAKVSPTWSTATNKSGSNRGRRLSEASLDEDFHEQPNDLHIHVTPQKTNGLIRLSVHGEKSQQQLQSKTELGVLYLPLGNAIAACVDVTASDSGTAMYERWFPLLTPREAVPVEGDRGLSHRPPESEKRDERGFKDYYKPCMQLALFWHPDKEFEYDEDEDEDELAVEGSDLPSSSSGVVKSYFNVDLACLSAALIDSDRAIELLSFTVLDLDVRYWITNAKARLGVALYWLQLDHQDDGTREPVVLAPTPNDFLFPVIQVFAVKDNIRSADVVSFDFIDVSVAEFDLTIEESLLYDVFAFFNSLSFRNGYDRINSSPDEAATQGDEPSLVSLVAVGFSDDSKKEKKVYIEQLFLGVIRVNLSYVKGKRAIWDSTSKSVGWMDQRIEEIIQPLWGHHQPSDVFAAWSRQTSDEDRFAEGKLAHAQS